MHEKFEKDIRTSGVSTLQKIHIVFVKIVFTIHGSLRQDFFDSLAISLGKGLNLKTKHYPFAEVLLLLKAHINITL